MMPCSFYNFRFVILRIVSCLIPFFSTISQAQIDISGYAVTHYTDENGLPQNSVSSIAPDSKGFLWLATEDGLVRFDGHSFFVLEKTTLKTADNRFRHFLPPAGIPGIQEPLFYTHNTYNKSYVGVYSDSYARKVAGYPDAQVRVQFEKRVKGIEVNHITSLPWIYSKSELDTLKSPDVGILPVGNNAYYCRYNGNIEYYEGGVFQYRTYVPRNRELFFNNGKLFAAQKDGDLVTIDRTGTATLGLGGDILKNPCYRKCKLTYYWNNISQQTFIHLNGSLYSVAFGSGNRVQTSLILTGMDFDQHWVISIYMDKFGNIFLGCSTEGLYILRKKIFNTMSALREQGLAFYAIAPAGDNAVIDHQGYRVDFDNRSLRQNRKAPEFQWPWYFLSKDKQGSLWVVEETSPIDRRLSKYSADGKQLLAKWDVDGAVNAVFSDRWGKTWFETDRGELYQLPITQTDKSAPSFVARTNFGGISCFYRSEEQRLWLGSLTGLYTLNIATGKIDRISALAGKNVRNIYGSGNQLWICTYGDGLYLYQNKKLTHFPIDEQRYLASVHCIVPDSKGRFWMSTNKGLFAAMKSDLLRFANDHGPPPYFHYFDKSSGFNTNEFNGGCQPCGLRLNSGNIVLPSMDGLVYFMADRLSIEYPDGQILISEVIVDRKAVESKKSINVRRNFEQIQIQVSTPYTGQTKNIQFNYRVSTGDRAGSWIPLTSQGRIYLTGLSPGAHRVEIRKLNGFGKDNYSYASMEIVVPPYWFETWWFTMVVILTTIAISYLFFRQRARYLARERNNKDLLDKARLYGNIIASINHDIQTPMHYLIQSFEFIVARLNPDEKPGTAVLNTGQAALVSLRRINTLTNNLLHYLKVNLYSHNYPIAQTAFEVAPLVNEIFDMFSEKIARDQIRIVNQVEKGIEFTLSRPIFSVILHNLIDNAVKISKNGAIKVWVEEQGGGTQLAIQDSGKGMPPSLVEWLTETSGKTNGPDSRHAGSAETMTGGLGLLIVKDLCRLSGIKLHVRSSGEEGTCLLLAIPELGELSAKRRWK